MGFIPGQRGGSAAVARQRAKAITMADCLHLRLRHGCGGKVVWCELPAGRPGTDAFSLAGGEICSG